MRAPWSELQSLGCWSTLRQEVTLGYKKLHTPTDRHQKGHSWVASEFLTHENPNLLKVLEWFLVALKTKTNILLQVWLLHLPSPWPNSSPAGPPSPGHTRLLQCSGQTALPHAEVPCCVLAVPLPGLPSPRAPPADPSSGFSSSGTPFQAPRLGEDSAIPSAKHTWDSLFNSLSAPRP